MSYDHDDEPYDPNLPADWQQPNWREENKVHNWRNHVSDEVRELWPTFSDLQKKALARQAEVHAMAEHWD